MKMITVWAVVLRNGRSNQPEIYFKHLPDAERWAERRNMNLDACKYEVSPIYCVLHNDEYYNANTMTAILGGEMDRIDVEEEFDWDE